MSTELIRPNWHVVIIHYPLALLTVGLVIEVFSFLWRRSTLRTAGRWMILLGAVFSIPAATTGLYAFRNVMAPGPTEPQVAWYRLVERSPWSDAQWHLMTRHVIFAGIGTGVIAISLLAWLAVSDATRRRAHWLLVLVAVGGLGCLSAAAWYSGEAIYRHGTAVERPAADHAAVDHHQDHDQQEHAAAAAAESSDEGFSFEDAVPPLQVHVAFAGLTVAAAIVALGLSLHWWARERPGARRDELAEHLDSSDAAAAARAAEPPGPPDAESAEAAAILGSTPSMPFPSRYWLLTLLFGLAAYASGLWQAEDWKFGILTPDGWHHETRLAWHAVVGLALAVLLLLLALLTRFFRRWRTLGYAVGLLMVLAAVIQLASGSLMLFDSTTGPLLHLRHPAATQPTSQPAP